MKTNRLSYVVLLAVCGVALVSSAANAAPLVSDPNLLQGIAAIPGDQAHSSDFDPVNYGVAFATNLQGNGAGKDFVFSQGDSTSSWR